MPKRVQDIVPAGKKSIRNVPLDRGETAAPSEAKPRRRTAGRDIRPPAEAKQPVYELELHRDDQPAPRESRAEKSREQSKSDVDAPLVYIRDTSTLEDRDSAPADSSGSVERFNTKRLPITPPIASVRPPRNKKGMTWVFVTLGVIAVIIVGAYIASTTYSQATFTIVPKMIPVAVNGTYVAQLSTAPEGMTYQLVTVKSTSTSTVTATDGPAVSTKAQGKVTLYNANPGTSQRLVAGTRLSTDSGLVYRLSGSVVIPGATGSATAATPGTVAATVVADQPGQQYNIGKNEQTGDLKIVAYKGTPKYTTIYARLSGDISGGFVGAKKTVSPATLASTTALLKTKLVADLLARAKNSEPDGYIMYPNAYITSYGLPQVGGADRNQASVAVQGTLYAVMFKKTNFISQIAGSQTVAAFGGYPFDAPGLESLDVSIANAKDFQPDKKTSLILKIKGSLKLIGIIPVDELKAKFAGVSLAETQNILKPYAPIIQTGSGELVPPWVKVPKDLKRITIKVDTP